MILPDLAFNYFSGKRLHFGLQVCVVLEDDLGVGGMVGLEMPLKDTNVGSVRVISTNILWKAFALLDLHCSWGSGERGARGGGGSCPHSLYISEESLLLLLYALGKNSAVQLKLKCCVIGLCTH